MKQLFGAMIACTLCLGATHSFAHEKPPVDAKPLSEVIKALEAQGYSPITEVSVKRDQWEVEAYKDGVERELRIDPIDGKILSDRLDD